MACFTEWGGANEIQAMSLLYKREFIIFNGQKQAHRSVTDNGFKDALYLCHTPQKQYETIYTRDFVATAAYCQCKSSLMFTYLSSSAFFEFVGDCRYIVPYNLLCSYCLPNIVQGCLSNG